MKRLQFDSNGKPLACPCCGSTDRWHIAPKGDTVACIACGRYFYNHNQDKNSGLVRSYLLRPVVRDEIE